MVFNPKESIDFNGNTGPFIQYTYARIQSVLRRGSEIASGTIQSDIPINEKEEDLIQLMSEFPAVVQEAADTFSPSVIANYIYDLAKEYNQFYHDYSILKEENEALRKFRLTLSLNAGKIIQTGFSLLGIQVPERM
jgi:arginyl-tRNA synthetase